VTKLFDRRRHPVTVPTSTREEGALPLGCITPWRAWNGLGVPRWLRLKAIVPARRSRSSRWGPPGAAVGLRQGQGRRRGQNLDPLGAAVDGAVFVRIDLAPGPIPAVPLQGARAHAQDKHGPQPEHDQPLLDSPPSHLSSFRWPCRPSPARARARPYRRDTHPARPRPQGPFAVRLFCGPYPWGRPTRVRPLPMLGRPPRTQRWQRSPPCPRARPVPLRAAGRGVENITVCPRDARRTAGGGTGANRGVRARVTDIVNRRQREVMIRRE
jgi:hypothetical protein